jgi:hypothetical protein
VAYHNDSVVRVGLFAENEDEDEDEAYLFACFILSAHVSCDGLGCPLLVSVLFYCL